VGAGAAACSTRAASISRALWLSTRVPYFENSGDAFADLSTSSVGPMRDEGGRKFILKEQPIRSASLVAADADMEIRLQPYEDMASDCRLEWNHDVDKWN
jgi:hypothetical protein